MRGIVVGGGAVEKKAVLLPMVAESGLRKC